MATILEKINAFPGYRIRESHFRIGSKIHVSEFYFAKRFFQNSYYASRLAFLLAKQILAEEPAPGEFKKKGLTLIGYGLYSELLLSLIERFLGPKVDNRINHDIVDDADEPELLRGYGPIYEHIAIIVPIASAFSTSMKIEDSLRSRPENEFKNKTFLKSHFNVLHIHHSGAETPEWKSFIKTLGWRGEDKKSVHVQPFFAGPRSEDEIRYERYLLRLPSHWYPVDDCDLCFPPSDPISEKPLFISDRSSVTPDLIFSYPKEREKAAVKPFIIKNDHIVHGHLRQSRSHFRFYIRVEEFFRDNESRVDTWLREIRREAIEKDLLTDLDRVVIIAPAQFSNAAFVNKVNQVLCSDAATIIHYDPTNDDIQNFRIFYEHEFASNVKVFFVDDTITTGRTFLRTNYFIKHTRPSGDSETRGLDGVIVLLDRSDEFVFKNISRKLNGGEGALFTFAGLHIPLLKVAGAKCPLCLERERYIDLASRSYLDVIKAHLLTQAAKLDKSTSPGSGIASIFDEKTGKPRNHNLRKIEAMFRIVEWFSKGNNLSDVNSFEDWIERLIKEIEIPFASSFSGLKSDGFISDFAATILKVTTYTQFSHYKSVRSKLFPWLLKLLDEKVKRVKKEIEEDEFTVTSLRELKFLMRRAGRLNSNFLISKGFFNLLKLMLSEETVNRLRTSNGGTVSPGADEVNSSDSNLSAGPLFENLVPGEEDSRPKWERHLSDLMAFYVVQVKELCSVSDSRCVRLEKQLQHYESAGQELPPRFRQLLRFLKAENSIVIENFWELARKQLIPDENVIAETTLDNVFDNFSAHSHYRYQSLKSFLHRDDRGIREDKELEAYLKMSLFLAQEHLHKLSLQEKTERVIEGLRSIADNKSRNGAFFIVRYKETDDTIDNQNTNTFSSANHFVAYNRSSGDGPINPAEIFSANQKYLGQFFNGTYVSNSNIDNDETAPDEFTASVIELRRGTDYWYDAYSAGAEKVEIDESFLPYANRLILIRFASKKLSNGKVIDRPQGMVAIYSNTAKSILLTSNRLRYLLLLRGPINDFVSKHHNNAEFRDWVDADKERRISLLTGHGRETLMRFARNADTRYFDIIQTILFVQRMIIDKQDESDLFNQKGLTPGKGKFSITDTFKTSYSMKSEVIDKEYAEQLVTMAETIFESELVENEVVLAPIKPKISEDFSCRFPKKILDMIFFELFVNAKKNRWIFDKDESFNDGKEEYRENRIWIEFDRDRENNQSIFKISNTGPAVGDASGRIFSQQGIKDYADSVAGTKHIQTLLDTFDLGSAHFKQEPLAGQLKRATVTLYITEME